MQVRGDDAEGNSEDHEDADHHGQHLARNDGDDRDTNAVPGTRPSRMNRLPVQSIGRVRGLPSPLPWESRE